MCRGLARGGPFCLLETARFNLEVRILFSTLQRFHIANKIVKRSWTIETYIYTLSNIRFSYKK